MERKNQNKKELQMCEKVCFEDVERNENSKGKEKWTEGGELER